MNMGGLSPQSCEDTKQKKDCQNAKIINHKSNSQKQYQSKFRVWKELNQERLNKHAVHPSNLSLKLVYAIIFPLKKRHITHVGKGGTKRARAWEIRPC